MTGVSHEGCWCLIPPDLISTPPDLVQKLKSWNLNLIMLNGGGNSIVGVKNWSRGAKRLPFFGLSKNLERGVREDGRKIWKIPGEEAGP